MRTGNRLQRSKKKSNNTLVTGDGLYSDIIKWSKLYIDYIDKKTLMEEFSVHTQRSYLFTIRNICKYTFRNYNIKEGLNDIDENYINDFLEWLEHYNYNTNYGTEDYVADTINIFLDYCDSQKEDEILELFNNYINNYYGEDFDSINNILSEFINEYMEENPISLNKISDNYIDNYIVNIERTKLKKVTNKTMLQRKNSLLGFFKYISNTNTDKIDITQHFKFTNKYLSSKSDTINDTKRRKGYSEYNQMKLVDKRLRDYLLNMENNKRVVEKSKYNATRDITLALIMMYGGLRASESISLKFEDIIETEEGSYEIKIKNGKGGKSRTTNIYKPLIEKELQKLKDRSNHLYLSSTSSGKTMSYDNLRVSIKKILGDLYNNGLHTFRHTFAIQMAKTGDIALVADLLGHSDLKTTQIYIDINNDRKSEGVVKIQKTFLNIMDEDLNEEV